MLCAPFSALSWKASVCKIVPRTAAFWHDTRLLLRVRVHQAKNAGKFAGKTARRVGFGLFGGALVLFVLVFWAFAALLGAVQTQSTPAANSLIEQTHFWVFLFLLAGGTPFVSGVLFAAGDEANLLANSPASPAAFVTARLGDAVVAASAQFVVLGVPLLLACGFVLHLSFFAWLVFVLLMILQIALPALLVAALLLLCARIVGVRRVKGAVALTSALLAVALCLVSVQALSQQASQGLAFSSLASAAQSAARSANATHNSAPWQTFLPPFWAARALLGLASPRPLHAAPWAGLLAATAAALGALCVVLGTHILRGDLFTADNFAASRRNAFEAALSRLPLAPQIRAFLVKDAHYLFRDLVLVSQIGIPLILYFVPFVIGAQMKSASGADGASDLLYLCLGVVGTIAYMETSILGLSSLGLEGRGFWLVLSAPVSPGLLLRAKWTGAFAASALLCAPLWLVACAAYHAAPLLVWGGLSVLLIACAALCGLAVGIAGIFPRFVYENPAHRASLSALIWGFVLASAYVLVSGVFLGLGGFGASQWPEKSTAFWAGGLGAFLLLSLVALIVPLFAARRRLSGFAWGEG